MEEYILTVVSRPSRFNSFGNQLQSATTPAPAVRASLISATAALVSLHQPNYSQGNTHRWCSKEQTMRFWALLRLDPLRRPVRSGPSKWTPQLSLFRRKQNRGLCLQNQQRLRHSPWTLMATKLDIYVAVSASFLTSLWAFPRAATVLRRSTLHWMSPICLLWRLSLTKGAIVRSQFAGAYQHWQRGPGGAHRRWKAYFKSCYLERYEMGLFPFIFLPVGGENQRKREARTWVHLGCFRSLSFKDET